MSCEESPYVIIGFTWPGPHAALTPLEMFDSYTGKVRVDDRSGKIRDLNVVEGGKYTFDESPDPFTLEVLLTLKGSSPATSLMAFETCDIIVEDEPPSDLLGMLSWVKDQVVIILASITSLGTTIGFFNEIIASILRKVDDTFDIVKMFIANLNYTFDAFEIWVSDSLDFLGNSIISSMEVYKKDIISAIEDKIDLDPSQILEEIRAEIIQLGATLSDEVITKLWDYIEDQIFEKED